MNIPIMLDVGGVNYFRWRNIETINLILVSIVGVIV
jgi:hypothetical protein